MPDLDPEELLTPQRVSTEFGIPVSTVRALCRKKKLRHYCLPRRKLIRRRDVRSYLDACVVEPQRRPSRRVT